MNRNRDFEINFTVKSFKSSNGNLNILHYKIMHTVEKIINGAKKIAIVLCITT